MTSEWYEKLARADLEDALVRTTEILRETDNDVIVQKVKKVGIRRPDWVRIGSGKTVGGVKSVDGIALVANLSKTAVPLFLQIYSTQRESGYSFVALTSKTPTEQVAQRRAIKILHDSEVAKKIGVELGFTQFLLNPYAFCQSDQNPALRKVWDSLP